METPELNARFTPTRNNKLGVFIPDTTWPLDIGQVVRVRVRNQRPAGVGIDRLFVRVTWAGQDEDGTPMAMAVPSRRTAAAVE